MQHNPPGILETQRLWLRPTNAEDAAFFHLLANTPKWLQYIGDRGIGSEADARAYILKNTMSQQERLGFGNFTLIRKEDQAKIGTCGLYDREGLEGIDLGFALLPAYEGKGYGFEAASGVIEAAFHTFGLETLKAITRPDNQASRGLLAKLGFRPSGSIRLGDPPEELLLMILEHPKTTTPRRASNSLKGPSAINIRIREATTSDIPRMQQIRRGVRENILLHPEKVTDAICLDYITRRGRGWVAETPEGVVGFAIADLADNNIWALFLLPEAEGRGIGRRLHRVMMDWYFGQGKEKAWLSTGPGTRAEGFYRNLGWLETSRFPDGEIQFEMTSQTWRGGQSL
ncbi:GNAT family N-acetyltransferase [Robiginitalea sediminis]|uniref:GNAT family N-acetyltransferase n=1 Tax=Robiginitalea sediminis TaxID=1982593 RepID=UPI001E50542F|nr:GNAT family N-acetyltransferase [Robiginitalea sediminis]